MPNLRGPRARVRRLYATVVHFLALYGAPEWVESVRAIQLERASLDKVVTAKLSSPLAPEWGTGRGHGVLTYCLTQVLTGHGVCRLVLGAHRQRGDG